MSVLKIYSPNIYQHIQQIIQQELSLSPPQGLLAEFIDRTYGGSNHVERLISPKRAASMFRAAYIDPDKEDCGLDTATVSTPRRRKISLSEYEIMDHENPSPKGGHEVITALTGQLEVCGQIFWTQGVGDGLTDCLNEVLHSIGLVIKVLEHETAVIECDAAIKLGKDKYTSEKAVVTYVKCSDVTSCTAWGIGIGENKADAFMKAFFQAAASVSSFAW
ncbi:2-isopropylmalate synthase [Penicillium frequentans]|uniref:2-isopropylmalate synthase n=1 Tax=Penicillium frequentans TaxID=3151616 RepID=A0AAD6G8W3_9EURO|nr:2-isopropylmalate synthase [Penicillium glabrum]